MRNVSLGRLIKIAGFLILVGYPTMSCVEHGIAWLDCRRESSIANIRTCRREELAHFKENWEAFSKFVLAGFLALDAGAQ